MDGGGGGGGGGSSSRYSLQPARFCNEDILICVDVDLESQVEMKVSRPKCQPITRLDSIKQPILLFVNAELAINPDNRFAFSVLAAQSASWVGPEMRLPGIRFEGKLVQAHQVTNIWWTLEDILEHLNLLLGQGTWSSWKLLTGYYSIQRSNARILFKVGILLIFLSIALDILRVGKEGRMVLDAVLVFSLSELKLHESVFRTHSNL